MLRLLHISDIHFSTMWDGRPKGLDVERAVRQLMIGDFGRMAADLGQMHGILLVGDIAGRGEPAEYAKATEFLDHAATIIGAQPDRVVCVPGNHDVDRDLQDRLHGYLRADLRQADPRRVTDELARMLGEKDAARSLLAPFEAYNQFAIRYGCDISATDPTFPPKAFDLGRLPLRVHGITSAWICDGKERPDDEASLLVAGLFQAIAVGTDPGAVTMALSHHPPRWLRDAQQLEPWLRRVHFVLTGHEHEAGVTQHPDGYPLYVASGAVNPSRAQDGWVPAYNVIEIEAGEGAADMQVAVHTRVLGADRAEFGYEVGQAGPRRFTVPVVLPLPALTEPGSAPQARSEPEAVSSAQHAHTFAVFGYSPDVRRRAARRLGLLVDGDPAGLEADRLLIDRAVEQDRMPELAALLMEGSVDD